MLLVLVFHFRLLPAITSGFLGVDVFFVISGDLITRIVRRQQRESRFRLCAFWLNRVRRLAPALLATTILTLAAGALLLFPPDFAQLAKQTLAAQLYVANIYYWRSVNYFGLQAHDVYLLHTWSLAVEEQFYLLYPLLLLAIARWVKSRYVLIVSAMAVLSFGLNLFFVGSKPEATFYLMPTRAFELLAGALLTLVPFESAGFVRRPAWLALASGVGGAGCLVIAATGLRPGAAFPGWSALWPVVGGVLLVLAGQIGRNPVSSLLGVRPAVYLGRISYPLYLVHWPINVFAAAWFGHGYSTDVRAAMLAVSVVLAAAMHHGVENPGRAFLERSSTSTSWRWYAGTLAAVVLASTAVLATHGWPSRYPERVATLAAYEEDRAPELRECEFRPGHPLDAATMCRLGAAAVPPRWLVYGDSHLWAASGAFEAWLRGRGESARFVFRHGCLPVHGLYTWPTDGGCHAFNDAVMAALNGQTSIDRVMVVSIWRQAIDGLLSQIPGHQPSRAESDAAFVRELGKTLDELRRGGRRVYVWEPLPGARANVPQAMARAALEKEPVALAYGSAEHQSRYELILDALQTLRARYDGSFSPTLELCKSGVCATDIDGRPLYFDTTHLANSSSPFWAAALARQIPP